MAPENISVVVPTYNRATLVVRAVRSALRAISPGDEVIVVDDGSTDDTAAALASFGDRIRFVQAARGGAGAARNRGVAEATNPLIAFLDSDDEWRPDHLTLHRAVHIARPLLAFSFSDFSTEASDGRLRPFYLRNWSHDPRPWSEILGPPVPFSALRPLLRGREDFRFYVGDLYLAEMLSDYVPTFTLVARRDALPDTQWFAEDVRCFEDYQCFGRLAGVGLAAYLECETATQHGHKTGRLTDVGDLDKLSARILILQRVWGSDPRFLQRYEVVYHERLRQQQLLRTRSLLEVGESAAAREQLRQMRGSPLAYRIAAQLPGPAVHGAVKLTRRLKHLAALGVLPFESPA